MRQFFLVELDQRPDLLLGGRPGEGQAEAVAGAFLDRRAALPDEAPGQRLGGRYRIEALLGIGGMGVVYRATDEALDVPVAIKLLRPELAQRPEAFERFRQELLLARQVSSPHVVRIHDIARDGERWFISMDLVDGEALDRRLDREGTLPVEDALSTGDSAMNEITDRIGRDAQKTAYEQFLTMQGSYYTE